MRSRKGFKRDVSGGIEGLPLQLMIMVLIAGIGSAVLLGWMGNLEAPRSIQSVSSFPNEVVLNDDNGDGVFDGQNIGLTITVLDDKGDPITGATVVLDGSNVASFDGSSPHGTTGSNGQVTFSDLKASMAGKAIGFITVTVTKSGYGTDTSLTIPVIAG